MRILVSFNIFVSPLEQLNTLTISDANISYSSNRYKKALLPLNVNSLTPPTSVAIVGVPIIWASDKEFGLFSIEDGKT